MLENIIGAKIVAIKAFELDKRRKKHLEPIFILLNDGQTFIELTEQDYYDYHDCASYARILTTHIDKNRWVQIMENKCGCYPNANSLHWA